MFCTLAKQRFIFVIDIVSDSQVLARDTSAIGILGCVGTFFAAVDLWQPRVDRIEFESPVAPADCVTLTCNLDEIFAVVQTSSGAFASVVASGMSICATEHPRFELTVASASADVHLSKSTLGNVPAFSTNVFKKHAGTSEPFLKLLFESRRSSLGRTRRISALAAPHSLPESVDLGDAITSELGLATFLEWKDSDSLDCFEKRQNPNFREIAVFSMVGALNGVRVFNNLDDLLRILFIQSFVNDALEMSQQLNEAGFTPNNLLSKSVVASSPYFSFCSKMPSHKFISSPPPPTVQSESSAGGTLYCIGVLLFPIHESGFDEILQFFHVTKGSRCLLGFSVGMYDFGAELQATMPGRGVEKIDFSIP
jgi:hypothetical protein